MLSWSSTKTLPFFLPFGFVTPAGVIMFSVGMPSSASVYTRFFFFLSTFAVPNGVCVFDFEEFVCLADLEGFEGSEDLAGFECFEGFESFAPELAEPALGFCDFMGAMATSCDVRGGGRRNLDAGAQA